MLSSKCDVSQTYREMRSGKGSVGVVEVGGKEREEGIKRGEITVRVISDLLSVISPF